jgi:hypothetical protein
MGLSQLLYIVADLVYFKEVVPLYQLRSREAYSVLRTS